MSSLQIPRWTTKEVADWLKGLDECLQPYIQTFLNKGYTGETLLAITSQDLEDLEITKLGHQEILLEAIDLLKGINYDQPDENLQTVLLRLNTKATNLKNELEKILPANRDACVLPTGSLSIPATVLLRVTDTVTVAKILISWLDRPLFCRGEDDFQIVRREVLQHALDITQAVQKSTDIHAAAKIILSSSQELMLVTDSMIKQATDPLVITSTFIDEVTIKKKHQDEDLGLFLKTSSIDGIHVITGTKDESAAGVVGRIHSGDEVLQVNYQTVVGWDHKKVIDMVKEYPMRVSLTLRKRPKNLSTPGQYQRPPHNSFPIYRGMRPTAPEKVQTRSRKNSDPTAALRVDIRKIETGPKGAHSDDETPKPLKRNRCGTTGTGLLRKPPNSRHPDDRPRSLPEDIISEAIPDSTVAEWLWSSQKQISPINGGSASTDSQQTPSPQANNTTAGISKVKKSVRIADQNSNNNTHTSSIRMDEERHNEEDDQKGSIMSTESSMSTFSQVSLPLGMQQRPLYKAISYSGEEVQVPRRRKKRRYTVNKHVSCVDLGPGECEGWLKMKSNKKNFGSKWIEMWFVLKEYVLYYYKCKQDVKAKGVICLPGYMIQDASDSSKKFTFMVTHRGTDPIYFRSKTESNKEKWMDKLGLAAILYDTQDQDMVRQSVMFKTGLLKESGRDIDVTKPMPRIEGYHSESDEDDVKSPTPSSADSANSPGSITSPEETQKPDQKTPSPIKGQKLPNYSPLSPSYHGASMYSPSHTPSPITSPPPFMRRLKGSTTGSSSSPSTPNNTPVGSPTLLKRMITAIRRRSESTLFSQPGQLDSLQKSSVKKMTRSVSTPDFLDGSDPRPSKDIGILGSPIKVGAEGSSVEEEEYSGTFGEDMLKHYDSLKNSNVPVLGLDRTKAARVSRRESQKRTDWYRQQLQRARDARNDRALAKRALQQSLMDRKDELSRLEALFKDNVNHSRLQAWKVSNEDVLEHTLERLNKDNNKQNANRDNSESARETQKDNSEPSSATGGDNSTGASETQEIENDAEQISGHAPSSLVLGPARPRAESECSETSV